MDITRIFDGAILKAEELERQREVYRVVRTAYRAMVDEGYDGEEIMAHFHHMGRGNFDGLIALWVAKGGI